MSRKQKNRKKPQIVDVTSQRLEELVQRAESHAFEPGDYETVQQLLESYSFLTDMVSNKSTTIKRLRELLFGSSTESLSGLTGGQHNHLSQPTSGTSAEAAAFSEAATPSGEAAGAVGVVDQPPTPPAGKNSPAAKPRPSGHGRLSAEDYTGADRITIPLGSVQAGSNCPECQDGTLYKMDPGVVVRITGHAPLRGTVYELEKLRCNLCGVTLTAATPAEIGDKKYDATSVAIIGLFKYGMGGPFYRMAGLQQSIGVPVPASTQWDIVSGAAPLLVPAYHELIRQAAQGDVVYNDDTTTKILQSTSQRDATSPEAGNDVAPQAADEELMAEDCEVAETAASIAGPSPDTDSPHTNSEEEAASEESSTDDISPDRTGTFTTGIVSMHGGQRIVVYFSGPQHAGENLADVLRKRSQDLPPPIHMCDALSRNYPAKLKTILANCLAHARRRFVYVFDKFPDQCTTVLEYLAQVYHTDAEARRDKLSPEARFELHQRESLPVMTELKAWLNRQFDERLAEPNSGLGIAITYMLKHWDKLTLFLRQIGAPLDNNVCERMLKMVILNRKNAYFYKSQYGAQVGDIYMSLIQTCKQCGASPMDYLVQVQLHSQQVAEHPEQWMPWNYEEQLISEHVSEPESPADLKRRMRRARQTEFQRHPK